MDISEETMWLILVWILAIADILIFAIVAYSIYLFRKSTYDFEKQIRDQKN